MSSDHFVFKSTGTTDGKRAPPAWMTAPVLEVPAAAAPPAAVPVALPVPARIAAPPSIAPPQPQPQRSTPARRNSEWQTAEDEATDVIRPWTMRAWE